MQHYIMETTCYGWSKRYSLNVTFPHTLGSAP